ncbi:MAG: cyclopropane-fatty-acyl-phospholipid synthase family protein [Pseudomonadota bacterium]
MSDLTPTAEKTNGPTYNFYRRRLFDALQRIERGRLVVTENGVVSTFGQSDDALTDSAQAPVAHITIADPVFYREVVLDGALGAAESYMADHMRCEDLTALVRLFIMNGQALNGIDGAFSAPKRWLRDAFRFLVRNTRGGSRRNIAAHYDLGNDLFRLFLDPSMMYSSAVYPDADSSLDSAAEYKNELLCRKLALTPDDHLLEIGTGWGGFAIKAARDFGCRVTTTTVSEEQYRLATERVEQAGLSDRIRVLKCDYRDLTGQYNKIVSIEMLEAVGHEYFDTYFEKCSELLHDDGLMCLQTITMNEQNYLRARDHVDFIKKYIFPGGCLPSLGAICQSLGKVSDLNVMHVTDIASHYARTLRDWSERFSGALDQVRAQGYDERFVRMWRYYLHYCEAGFLERVIGDVQVVLFKPGNRRAPIIAHNLTGPG